MCLLCTDVFRHINATVPNQHVSLFLNVFLVYTAHATQNKLFVMNVIVYVQFFTGDTVCSRLHLYGRQLT